MPTLATAKSDSGQSTAERNSKLIGGLVGSVGGTIVIGCLVVLFLFLKKKKKFTNQSPDFNNNDSSEDSSTYNEKKTGFKKLFGSKNTNSIIGGVARSNDLERQINSKAGYSGAGAGAGAAGGVTPFDNDNDGNDGYQYRGITNSNNLDSIFRTSGTNTRANTSGGGSGRASTKNGVTGSSGRFGSVGGTLSSMPEGFHSSHNIDSPFGGYGSTANTDRSYGNPEEGGFGHSREASDETDAGFGLSDYDMHDDLQHPDRGAIFGNNDNYSNNSKSRFHEEII